VVPSTSSSSSSSKAEMMRKAAFRTPAEGLTRLGAILRVPSMAVLASSIQLATALASMSRRLERTAAGGESWGAPPNTAPTAADSGERPKQPQTPSSPTAGMMRRRHKGLTEWKALLCTLIADREVKSLRHDAKRLLRRLCVTQAAYHGVRDSYQFTAELRKVLHSLPPRAARAACEALRDPAAGASVPGAGGGRGLVYLNYPLDSIKAASKSTENAMLVQLKGRFKVQRLLVRIADAHGRLVRTIRLHYHSKPVATITDLRMPENAAKWRLAATVHVPRDKVSVQVDLPLPLT
ncbi:unnamed protein product, partial [Ectocarpus fasciculatus]